MEVSTPITKQPVGITFLVSVGLVVFIALLELGAITWAFIARFQASLPPASASAMTAGAEPVTPPPTDKLSQDDPLAAVTEPSPTAAQTPEEALPKPTPLPIARKEPVPAQSRATELVGQAQALRERGDTLTALTRLREAQSFAPNDPQIISEMAITYEKMGAMEKANDQWRRIYLIGESAGIYYAAAEAKLNANRPGDASPPANRSEIPTEQQSTAPTPASTPVAEADGTKDSAGFQPNATMGIAEIVREEGNDPSAQTKFTLKIAVKSRPGSKVDVHEIAIHVFFYDLVDNRSIVQTNANVNSQWTTAPVDWTEGNMEILQVEYTLPRPDVRDSSRPVENRKYFGYIARIYYKKELQDMRAEPVKLLQQFPPPVTLQAEDPR